MLVRYCWSGAKTLACGLADGESRPGICNTISRVAIELDPLRALTNFTKTSAKSVPNTSFTGLNEKDGGGGSSKRATDDVGRSDAMKQRDGPGRKIGKRKETGKPELG
jgi:hypothetical protein